MPENFSCQIIFRGGAATLNVLFIMSSHDMTITVITTCFFSFPVSSKMPKTRSSPLVWLVGPVSSTLSSTKLPSGLEVLSVFFHHHTEEKQTVGDSAWATLDELLEIWSQARIPTRARKYVVEQVTKYPVEWKGLLKSRSQASATSLCGKGKGAL